MAHKAFVDANYRFIAAGQEVNARIQQRQQALALYATLIVSLLAALVALKAKDSQMQVPIEWLVLGFPVSSLCFAFLNYKAERAITNLRRFMSMLEQLDNASDSLPSYNTHPEWAQGANQARKFHDYASVILVAGGNLTGLGAVLSIYPERIAAQPFSLVVSIILASISILLLLLNPRWSFKPSQHSRSTEP